MIIKTKNLIIRNFQEKDAVGLLEYLSHPRVNCFADDRLYSEESALAYISNTPKDMLRYAVCLKEDDFIIGDVFALREYTDTFSVGWHFNQRFEGKGLAYEAATEFLDYLFCDAGARRVYGFVEDDNLRSKRLCKRLGMRYERCMKEFISFVCYPDGTPRYEDTCIYAILNIENDTALVEHLRKLFSDARNVQVVGCDFRNFAVPKFPFKVVSNIPYGITSDIFKILMFESLGNFLGGSIVLQLEPTQKLFSRKLYNPYTVFYHTFFDLKLVYEVGPESFFPPPTVKSALLNIKRKQLFFDFKFKAKYLAFISCLLEKPDLSVKTALKSIFRKSQVRSISEKFGLNLNAQIVCLSPSQWVNCFLEMLEVVPEKFHPS